MITKIAVQRYEKFSLHRKFFLLKSFFLTIHEADALPEAVKCLIITVSFRKALSRSSKPSFNFKAHFRRCAVGMADNPRQPFSKSFGTFVVNCQPTVSNDVVCHIEFVFFVVSHLLSSRLSPPRGQVLRRGSCRARFRRGR